MSRHNKGTSHVGYDDEDDNYSDDFDDDAATDTSHRKYKTKSPLQRSASEESKKMPLDSTSYNRSNRKLGGRHGRVTNTGRASQEMKIDNIARRVLSARKLRINEIQNKNQDLLLQLKELKDENKLLKKTEQIHQKNLHKFEDRESDLPQLIQRQDNEVRSLRDQIRKWREKYEKTDRYLRDAEDELEHVKLKLKKLKSLADEKDLPERSELNNKLNKTELNIEEKDVKIKELERYIQNLEKNHKHEIGIERARQKELNKQLQQIREENEKLTTTVKEKEKEIQIKNIYVTRAQAKPPHRLPNSYNGTPHDSPPPRHRRPSLSETDAITPREKAKQMEEKRREELRHQRELKQQHNKLKKEKEKREMQEKEEQEIREKEKHEQRRHEEKELQEKEREMNEQAEREAQERQLHQEREQMKREAEAKHRLQQEKKEHDERVRAEKREREEKERRERERLEQERRAAEDRRRFEEDETLQAERKKKDEIFQKLREIDEGVSNKADKDKNTINDPFFITEDRENTSASATSKQSYSFTKPTENLHKGKPAHKDSNSNLSFTVGPSRRIGKHEVDDLEIGGYNPTFVSKKGVNGANSTTATKTFSLFDNDTQSTNTAMTANKTVKKTKLMEELFGATKDKDFSPKHDDTFVSTEISSKKPDKSTVRPSFPWDDDSSTKKPLLQQPKRENSATLFGGGSALVNDEELHKSNLRSTASLPRRQKQTNTAFHNRPVVNAINNSEDDIEEVIL